MGLSEVMNQARAESRFIADLLDIYLSKGEGLFGLSGPVVGIAELAAATRPD